MHAPNNTSPGDAVYEPFLGSGTTLIAAHTTGRHCFAVEIDPLYVDVAIRRWQAFTGLKAIRLSDGRDFNDLARAADEAQPAARTALPTDPVGRANAPLASETAVITADDADGAAQRPQTNPGAIDGEAPAGEPQDVATSASIPQA